MTLNLARSNVPHILVLLLSLSLNVSLFHSEAAVFKMQAILKNSAPNDPKWCWTIQGLMYPIHVFLISNIFDYQVSLHLTQRHASFNIQAILIQASALNDPKMTLNPTRSKVLHIYVTSVPDSHISVPFSSTANGFRVIQTILRNVYWMTPKWPWTLQGQMHTYTCY